MLTRRKLSEKDSRSVLEDGSKVQGYVLEYLAAGGMSVVYLATKSDKKYIVKEVCAQNTVDVPSLISEKALLERLSHPAIPKVEAFFTHQKHYYLILEYVDGNPLSNWLQCDSPPPIESVIQWGLQLCHIFEYLHSQEPPVIYRDLKPENVLLTKEGEIRLIDFGIARLHKGDRENDTSLLGSPITASPEHYGGTETDARSDIYTLGATLYELLTGGKAKKRGAFSFAPISDYRPEIKPKLEAVLAKSIGFKPEDRYQTAREFGRALRDAVGLPDDILSFSASFSAEELPSGSPDLDEHTKTVSLSDLGIDVPRPRPRFPLMRLIILLALLISGGLALHFPGLLGLQANRSLEASLQGDLFAAGQVDGIPVVFFGEDVGLFQVSSWREQTGDQRAETLAERLSNFYRTPCSLCNKTKLEPEDIKVGRHQETKAVVVFYAHQHPSGQIFSGPELLATIDQAQADLFDSTPRFVATYWRDLMRDLVNLSRGFDPEESAVNEELLSAMQRARNQLSDDESNVENLRKILAELTGSESVTLRKAFQQVPERSVLPDTFTDIHGYEPLRN